MQQKYLNQYYDLYEDFHLVKLPLLEQEVSNLLHIKCFGNCFSECVLETSSSVLKFALGTHRIDAASCMPPCRSLPVLCMFC